MTPPAMPPQTTPAPKSRRSVLPAAIAFAALSVTGAGLFAVAYEFAGREVATFAADQDRPKITDVRPTDGEAAALPTASVSADLNLPAPTDGRPSNGVDARTMTAATVRLYRAGDPARLGVPANLNTSGAGDAIVLTPIDPLAPGARYVFEVTDGVRDETGRPFRPHRSEFAVAAGKAEAFPAAFEKVELPTADAGRSAFTAITVGPDGKLYAGTFDGRIFRFPIDPDGTLGDAETITTVIARNQGPRLVTGLTFTPGGTAEDPTLWVSHGQMAVTPDGRIEGADDSTGKLSVLTGPDLSGYEDRVVGLPRGYKDHLNFQGAFGPDGAYYFTQGSHTGDGAPDAKWGGRSEHLLTAAVLRLDVAALPDGRPLDVRTADVGGDYDPLAAGAALTLYATGVRSGYDVLWHSNGHLYTAVNGAAGGGNTPAAPAGTVETPWGETNYGTGVPALAPVLGALDDVLLDVAPGTYYGHPNAARGEFVLAGGNPTPGPDAQEVGDYPVGTRPNPRWHAPAFSFGKHQSPNGLLEYRGATGPKGDPFGGSLDGAILVARYSGGDDVQVLIPADDGSIRESVLNVDGLRQFTDPLDVAEDAATGNVYVAEYGGRKITLLRPDPRRREPRGVPAAGRVTRGRAAWPTGSAGVGSCEPASGTGTTPPRRRRPASPHAPPCPTARPPTRARCSDATRSSRSTGRGTSASAATRSRRPRPSTTTGPSPSRSPPSAR